MSKKGGVTLLHQKNERCILKGITDPNQTILEPEVTNKGRIKLRRCYSYDQFETFNENSNRPSIISPERRQDKSTFSKMNTTIRTPPSDQESESITSRKNESKVLNKKTSSNSMEMQPAFNKVFKKLDLSDEFPCEENEALVSTSETMHSKKMEVAISDKGGKQSSTQHDTSKIFVASADDMIYLSRSPVSQKIDQSVGRILEKSQNGSSLLDLDDDSDSESECRNSVRRLSVVETPNVIHNVEKITNAYECKSPTQFVYVDPNRSDESISGLQDIDSWAFLGNENHESSVLFGTNNILENVLQCLKNPFTCADNDSIDTDYYNSLRETYFHESWSFSDESATDNFYRNEGWSNSQYSHETVSVVDAENSVEVALNETSISSESKTQLDIFHEGINTSFSFDFSDRT